MKKAKFACAVWTWGTSTKEQFVQALKDVSDIGYKYVESTKPTINIFKDDPEGFNALCAEYGVKAVSFYFHLAGTKENDIDDLESKLEFMQRTGVECISIQALGTGKNKATAEQLDYTLRTVTRMSELCKPYGILPCLHPHCNTSVMYADEVDFIMQNTDPDLLYFGPDTAHLLGGGADPVAVFRKYAERIKFTHMKDLKGTKAVTADNVNGLDVYANFAELGKGDVDFKAVFEVLNSVGYDKYLTSELDRAPVSNYESAKANFEFLSKNYL